MSTVTVWAPDAEGVDLVLDADDSRHRMRRRGEYWHIDLVALHPGTRYWLSVDGGPPRPDPRSASQPKGVHGPSEIVDHESFAWNDGSWRGFDLASAVLYELHIGTFTPEGTFDSAIERLAELRTLGVDAIEILPPVEFPGDRGWGYDGVDLYAPHHSYGGPAALKRLIDAAHGHGLGVIIDVVYNHLGPDGNYLRAFGPYFTSRFATPWGDALNFDDKASDGVRSFVFDNMTMWIRDYHADALRLDAVHAICDISALHVLTAASEHVQALQAEFRKKVWLIAENNTNDPRLVSAREQNGLGMNAQWLDDFHHTLHVWLTGENEGYYGDYSGIVDLQASLERTFVYDGRYSQYRRRTWGRSAAHLPSNRFVVCLQNHDQVGNRARGERSSALMSPQRQQVGLALTLMSPFVPMLFQGEEWGASTPFQYFTHHLDKVLGRAVSEGRRKEFADFGWALSDVPDPQAETTFTTSKLDWDERDKPEHAEILAWTRHLIALRKGHKAMFDVGRSDDFAVRRPKDNVLELRHAGYCTIANLERESYVYAPGAKEHPVLASWTSGGHGKDPIEVPSDGVLILRIG